MTSGGTLRMQAKNWFLTFPRCEVSKEDALANILSKFPSPVYVLIAREMHEDGTPHLHIALWLDDKLRISSASYFDFVTNQHGSYETMRSPKGTRDYLHKSDPSPLTHGNSEGLFSAANKSKSTTAANLLLSGASLDDVCKTDPGFFLTNGKKIKEFSSYVQDKAIRDSIVPLVLPICYFGDVAQTEQIVRWFNENLGCIRQFKSPQLYLSSPHNHYKTSLIIHLSRHLRVYWLPMFEDFYDDYCDANYDLICLDEFMGQKTISFLNSFVAGGIVNVRKKGSQTIKARNLPVVILSNKCLSDIYNKPEHAVSTAALRCRFLEIALTSPMDLINVHVNGKAVFENTIINN